MVASTVAVASTAYGAYSGNKANKDAKKQAQQQQETGGLPTWLADASKDAVGRATTLADKPYTPYTAPLVAGINPDQTRASDISNAVVGRFSNDYYNPGQNLIKSSVYNPNTVSGRDVNTNAFGYDTVGSGTVSTNAFNNDAARQYMNPYIQQALNPAVRDLEESGLKTQNAQKALASQRGAFGGSRASLMELGTDKNTKQAVGDTLSKGYASAYDNAQGMFTSDQNRILGADTSNRDSKLKADLANQDTRSKTDSTNQESKLRAALANQAKDVDLGKYNETARLNAANSSLNAGKALGDMGSQWNTVQNSNVDRLLKTGATGQQNEQDKLTANYGQFLREQGYSQEQLNALLSAIQGAPLQKGGTGAAAPATTNPITAGIGTGMQGYGLYNQIAGSGAFGGGSKGMTTASPWVNPDTASGSSFGSGISWT